MVQEIDAELDLSVQRAISPEEYKARRAQSMKDMKEAREGGKELILPVFFMGRTDFKPGDVTSLHLFEPRYRALAR